MQEGLLPQRNLSAVLLYHSSQFGTHGTSCLLKVLLSYAIKFSKKNQASFTG